MVLWDSPTHIPHLGVSLEAGGEGEVNQQQWIFLTAVSLHLQDPIYRGRSLALQISSPSHEELQELKMENCENTLFRRVV